MTPSEDRRQASRRESDEPQKDWRGLVMAALWMVLFAVVGAIVSKTNTEMDRMREQIQTNAMRNAVIETEQKNMRDMLVEVLTRVQQIQQQQQTQQDRKR